MGNDFDKLDEIFLQQRLLINKLSEKFPDREMKFHDLIAAMHNELEELRNSFPWKKWKENYADEDAVDIENAKIEVIDLLFFLTEFMILILNMDANEVYRLYLKKHQENLTRYKEGY